jgi:hypothetical protein
MDNNWKNNLKILADRLRTQQKNKKGTQNKFDKVIGYKNKAGFNDTGIPLTARAAKNLQRNKAAYRKRINNYEGTTLQQINEERAAEGRARWKNSKRRPAPNSHDRSKDLSVREVIWRTSARESRGYRDDGWSNRPSDFDGYGYGDRPTNDGSVEIDVGYHKERPAPISDVDENKFPKVAEAIRAIKNKL